MLTASWAWVWRDKTFVAYFIQITKFCVLRKHRNVKIRVAGSWSRKRSIRNLQATLSWRQVVRWLRFSSFHFMKTLEASCSFQCKPQDGVVSLGTALNICCRLLVQISSWCASIWWGTASQFHSFSFQAEVIINIIFLQNAILTYNASTAKKWDFTALQLYCTQVGNES